MASYHSGRGKAASEQVQLAMLKAASAALNVYVEREHNSLVKILKEGTPYTPYETSDTSDVQLGNPPDESIYPTH